MILLIVLSGLISMALSIFLFIKFQSSKYPFFVCFTFMVISVLLILIAEKAERVNIMDISIDRKPEVIKASEQEKSSAKTVLVKVKDQVLLDAPNIRQFPELPRGCEVTSLAMLLQYKDINVDKMELADKVKKNTVPLKEENVNLYWGDPNDGFIGDMYSYANPGYGVYHNPIKILAEQYLPGKIIDLTGREFSELQTFLSLGNPVWVITNTTFKKLPATAFEKWNTPNGDIKITYKEHSVLITGYDNQTIYFNDPIDGVKNKGVKKEDFIEAWKQMGSQSLTFLGE
ncbi:C39 family peptidase [Robertmurraya massiliosenegalensis]|uniref:C39 family peptidase n=1 Tax=Robertmurraya massiliosenegalensis TaxID=1287657 RepID=UPI000381AB46|nr:C39 family peptidase [Robertmurraya massiliosenegalensis]